MNDQLRVPVLNHGGPSTFRRRFGSLVSLLLIQARMEKHRKAHMMAHVMAHMMVKPLTLT